MSTRAILLEHADQKFEINRTKIKGGCQSGRKVVTHNSKSDLPLIQRQTIYGMFVVVSKFNQHKKWLWRMVSMHSLHILICLVLFSFVLKLTVGSFWQYIFSNISESDRSRRFSWVGRVVEICGPQPPY